MIVVVSTTTSTGSTPLVGVLALQGDVREHARALEAAGARAVPVRRPSEVMAVDGLVLPGGESTTIDKLARTFGLHDLLRERIAGGMPVYGSCAGLIMLADRLVDGIAGQQTFGGLDVLVRRNAFGRQVESFEEDLDVAGVEGGPVRAAFIRAPWVEEVGAGVEVLARTSGAAGTRGRRDGWSPSGPGTCWPPPSTRRSPVTTGCTRCSCGMVLRCSGRVTRWGRFAGSDTLAGRITALQTPEEVLMSGHSKWATTKHQKAVEGRQAQLGLRQAHQEHRGRRAHRRG